MSCDIGPRIGIDGEAEFRRAIKEDDVFTSFAGATELTAELAGTFIKEVLAFSTRSIEIVWKFRDVFDMQDNGN